VGRSAPCSAGSDSGSLQLIARLVGCTFLLVACNVAPGDGVDLPPAFDRPSEEVHISAPVSDTLRLRIQAPDHVPAGEPIPISLHLENISDRTLDLYLRGRTITFDLVVADAAGEVVWRRLEGEVIPAILRIEPLPAGESLTLEASWDQRTNAGDPVDPGMYTVYGELLTESDPLATPTEWLRIEPN
jgi:hypothetical protein